MLGQRLTHGRLALLVTLACAGCGGDELLPLTPQDAGFPDAATVSSDHHRQDAAQDAEPSAVADAGPPPSSIGSCCQEQATAGCEEPAVEACVCAIDRLCCAGAWDERCVALVDSEGCGQCGDPPSMLCAPSETGTDVPSALLGRIGEVDGVVTDALELSCGSFAEPDVLFSFTAPEAGSYSFSTRSSEVLDTVLAVLDGAVCDGEELGCNDDDGAELTSKLELELAAGQEVLIAVESWGEESGEIAVEIAASESAMVIEPASCAPSELSGPLPLSAAGEANDAADLLTPSCAVYGSAGEALYMFTAEQAGRYSFDTRGSGADTLVQVLDGDCSGQELACNDDSDLGGLAAIAELELVAGQTVIINVDSLDGTGSYMLTVDRSEL